MWNRIKQFFNPDKLTAPNNIKHPSITILHDITPETGVPEVRVLSNSNTTVVVFYNGDKGGPSFNEAKQTDVNAMAVYFENCIIHKLGNPNDEVLHGHALYKFGLNVYAGQQIEHSQWLAEVIKVNSVHSRRNPVMFEKYKHYLISFKENTFECLAESYRVEVHSDKSVAELCMLVAAQLF